MQYSVLAPPAWLSFDRTAEMVRLRILLLVGTLAGLLLAGCQTPVPREPIGSDDELSKRAVGAWVRDESYPYGRFIGTLVLERDGSGTRKFDQLTPTGSGDAPMFLKPLLVERFRWKVKGGYIVFTQRRITDLEPGSPSQDKTEDGEEHAEFISALTTSEMKTIDPRKKLDTYEKVGAKRTESMEHPPADTAAADGRSFETAVVIQAADESSGVKAEYAWIRANFPKGQPAGQKLLGHGNRMYDLIHVELPDGSIRDVYFDISSFFGKL
jgi:hypothetical protein